MPYQEIFTGPIIAIAIFIFAASFLIGYLIQAFSYKKLLTLANYPKPKRAFIPFSNGYFIGHLSATVHPSMTDEAIAARRHKRGIWSFILTTLIPFVLTVLFLIHAITTLAATLAASASSSSSLSTTSNDIVLATLLGQLLASALGYLFLILIFAIIGLYFTISMYKKFCNTTIEAVAWALVPPTLAYVASSAHDSLSTLISIIVMVSTLVFAYTRKFYDPTK